MSFPLIITASVLFAGIAATDTFRYSLYTNLGLNDKAFTENILFLSPVRSVSHCTMLCSQQDDCVTFTFHQMFCRGHDALVTPVTPSTLATGARSFASRLKETCQEINKQPKKSGVGTVTLGNNTTRQVYFDQDTDGGCWIVFQRRQDGSVDFYRDWAAYQSGFGDPSGEFWLGLDAIHMLTSGKEFELRIDLVAHDDVKFYVTYSNFSISSSSDNYRLHFDDFTGGNAGDTLTYSRGQQFSTKDKDNDGHGESCAQKHMGAWWYANCYKANLNGVYGSLSPSVMWSDSVLFIQPPKFIEMKMRPV